MDIDFEGVINLKKKFMDETDRYKFISKSIFDYSWIEDVKKKTGLDDLSGQKILFIAEGTFMSFKPKNINS